MAKKYQYDLKTDHNESLRKNEQWQKNIEEQRKFAKLEFEEDNKKAHPKTWWIKNCDMQPISFDYYAYKANKGNSPYPYKCYTYKQVEPILVEERTLTGEQRFAIERNSKIEKLYFDLTKKNKELGRDLNRKKELLDKFKELGDYSKIKKSIKNGFLIMSKEIEDTLVILISSLKDGTVVYKNTIVNDDNFSEDKFHDFFNEVTSKEIVLPLSNQEWYKIRTFFRRCFDNEVGEEIKEKLSYLQKNTTFCIREVLLAMIPEFKNSNMYSIASKVLNSKYKMPDDLEEKYDIIFNMLQRFDDIIIWSEKEYEKQRQSYNKDVDKYNNRLAKINELRDDYFENKKIIDNKN